MLGVRADSAENNEGLGGEPGKVQVGKGADFDGGRLAVRVEGAAAVEDGLELGGGAAGDGPAEGGGEMAGDVLGRELAGVAWVVLVVLLGWGGVEGVPVAPKTTMSYRRLCFGEAILGMVGD